MHTYPEYDSRVHTESGRLRSTQVLLYLHPAHHALGSDCDPHPSSPLPPLSSSPPPPSPPSLYLCDISVCMCSRVHVCVCVCVCSRGVCVLPYACVFRIGFKYARGCACVYKWRFKVPQVPKDFSLLSPLSLPFLYLPAPLPRVCISACVCACIANVSEVVCPRYCKKLQHTTIHEKKEESDRVHMMTTPTSVNSLPPIA